MGAPAARRLAGTEPVLFLGRPESPVLAHLRATEAIVHAVDEPLDAAAVTRLRPSWIVSHGYTYILRPETLAAAPDRWVNLHISLLPWNRGADPNLWSWVDETPKGVTIHHIDAGVDTGDVIAQRETELEAAAHTLASSYAMLQEAMLDLFRTTWPAIRTGSASRRRQLGEGSYHRIADRAAVEHLLVDGWDTPVAALIGALRK